MNEQDERVTNEDYDDEITWNELLEELSKKHGNIPKYLYKAISETPESSATSPYEDTEGSREEGPDAGGGMSNLEAQRRSPGVDSGCSMGFNEDDDDDDHENNEHSLNDNSIKKIWEDLKAIRDTTISIAKQFIYVFDVIEDVKYMNESTSSRESLSSSASGSQDHLSLPQRQRKFNLRKLSRSVPNARGACPQLISRHQRKRSEDLRLRLFHDSLGETKAASSEEKINETADGRSLRRASDDSLAMNLKVTESSHRRSNSLSYGEKKEDQWMQNVLDFDAQHRSVPNFAELLRAQNDEMSNHFSLEGRPRNNDMIHHGPAGAISVDDISVQVDIVLESQLPDGIDLDNVSDKYDIQNDGERESSSADEIGQVCINGYRSSSVQKDEKQNETNSISDDVYVIQNSNDSRRGRNIDTTCNDASNDDLRESNLDTDYSSNHHDNWGKHKEVTIGNNLVQNNNVQDATNNTIQKSLASGDSPRKSWLHSEGRSSYNERMNPKSAEERMIRARSHSLHSKETNVSDDYDDDSDDDHYETQTDQRKAKSTQQPKKRPKMLLKRSPTYHETRPQQKQSPIPSKDINFSNTISPRYFQLLLMLEEGDATEL